MSLNCPSCGAPANGRMCEFCGRLLVIISKAEEELELVDRFHELFAKKNKRGQQLMLRNGFLPQNDTALIEAGLRCLPLIDSEQISSEPTRSAYLRLKAIVAKLRVRNSDASRQALPDLESALESHKRNDVLSTVMGLIFMVAIGAVVIWLIRVYFPAPR